MIREEDCNEEKKDGDEMSRDGTFMHKGRGIVAKLREVVLQNARTLVLAEQYARDALAKALANAARSLRAHTRVKHNRNTRQ